MRIAEYIACGVAIAVFTVFFIYIYSVVGGVLSMISISIPGYIDTAIRYSFAAAGGGFVAYVVFDYVYSAIVGEEE